MTLTRRDFSQVSLAAILAAQTAPFIVRADDAKKFRIVLIGSGWWGMNILNCALDSGACEVAALCDVDERMLAKACGALDKRGVSKPKLFKDFRECLVAVKPDIAIVATPDHWHNPGKNEFHLASSHLYSVKNSADFCRRPRRGRVEFQVSLR